MGSSDTRRAEAERHRREAMESIVAAHESALLRYATGLLHDAHAAQDVVQNAFIKLFRRWQPGMQPTAHVRSWLYRVTHNEAVDHVRRESRLRLLHLRHAREPAEAASPHNPGPAPEQERLAQVMARLRDLPAGERQVILLRLQEGLSYREIARITGRTAGNVGCLLHHAVKKLSRMMAAEAAG